jgi:hypothetical protein
LALADHHLDGQDEQDHATGDGQGSNLEMQQNAEQLVVRL